jgi:hypothetical protein
MEEGERTKENRQFRKGRIMNGKGKTHTTNNKRSFDLIRSWFP